MRGSKLCVASPLIRKLLMALACFRDWLLRLWGKVARVASGAPIRGRVHGAIFADIAACADFAGIAVAGCEDPS